MRYRILFACAAALFSLCSLVPLAMAVDADDDIKPDESERINFDANVTTAQSAEIESKLPEEAKAIREVIQHHIDHATSKDLDAYMEDFVQDRLRYPELEREYAQRAMALKDLKLDLRAIEFVQLTNHSATVYTRQISSYTDDHNQKIIDDAIISYRMIKADNKSWKIAFTERKRLVAP